jgi:hypothetical protein
MPPFDTTALRKTTSEFALKFSLLATIKLNPNHTKVTSTNNFHPGVTSSKCRCPLFQFITLKVPLLLLVFNAMRLFQS